MNQRNSARTILQVFFALVLTEKGIVIISIAELISFHSEVATQYYHSII